MNPPLRKTIAIALSAAILWVLFYGSYLPYRKSELFIQAMSTASSAKTFGEFTGLFAIPLDAPSPIGQEELVRNLGSTMLDLLKSNGENAQLTQAATAFLNGYYKPIIDRGRGMSFEQNLFMLGSMNEIAYLKTKDTQYLAAAQQYLEQGRELGPKRPQFLYGLMDIYRLKGDMGKATGVAQEILTLWPNDEKLKNALIPTSPASKTGADKN